MDFLQILTATSFFESGSFSIPLFFFSTVLLIAGVWLEVRSRAVRLSAIENRPLNWIEATHPHLPSLRFVVVIALCSVTLLLVSLQTLEETFPFNDPYHGLNLASLFILGSAIGILCEMKWKGAKEYTSALLSGTALAFLLIIIHYNIALESSVQQILLGALLLPSLFLIGSTHVQKKNHTGPLVALIVTFGFWMTVYLLQ